MREKVSWRLSSALNCSLVNFLGDLKSYSRIFRFSSWTSAPGQR